VAKGDESSRRRQCWEDHQDRETYVSIEIAPHTEVPDTKKRDPDALPKGTIKPLEETFIHSESTSPSR